MTSQYVWIAIIFGVFAAGLGMGYVTFQQSTHFNYMMINQQQMRDMMGNPQQMAMWQQVMMDDPEAMEKWMESPQHVRQMADLMRGNHDFMQEMMMEMINDPNLRLQMLGHMSENQEAMEQMQQMAQGGMTQNQMMGNMTIMDDDMSDDMMNNP
ncbi:MAG: DUF4175 domain-containing protein [Nitrosarchaeum sp.]|nr:DUF4175 domain-containing protein [Nitrosarchaeum sp.]